MPTQGTLLGALLSVQQEAPALKKTAVNSHFRNSYAPLDKIVETINPILHKHKLVWTTKPSHADGEPTLKYKMVHTPSGESDEGEMLLLLSKQDAQAQGSAITYARRYAICAYLNLVAEDDDDGVRAATSTTRAAEPNGRPGRASEKQIKFLHDLIKRKKPTVAQLRTLLEDVGAGGVEIKEGWADLLTGGTEGQVSALIERLKSDDLPSVEESQAPKSDIPEPAEREFEHPPADLQSTPWAV